MSDGQLKPQDESAKTSEHFINELRKEMQGLQSASLNQYAAQIDPEIAAEAQPEVKAEEPVYTEIEKAAMAKGWKPNKEQVAGDKVFLTAEQFLANGPVIQQNKELIQKTAELEKKIKELADAVTRSEELARTKLIDDLNKQRLEAISVGDTQAFIEADEKYQKLVQPEVKPVEVPQPQAQPMTEEAKAFLERNGNWFNQNKENKDLVAVAQLADSELVNYPHFTQAESFQYIENRVKEAFPHKFKPAPRAAPSPVEAKSTIVEPKSQYTFNQLNEVEKTVYLAIKKSNPKYTVDQFKAEQSY